MTVSVALSVGVLVGAAVATTASVATQWFLHAMLERAVLQAAVVRAKGPR